MYTRNTLIGTRSLGRIMEIDIQSWIFKTMNLGKIN